MECRYHPGDMIWEKWKLVREIGTGGYAKVFEAERREFGEVYKSAIKIITIPQSRDEINQIRAESPDEVSVYNYYQSMVEKLMQEVRVMSLFKGTSNIISYEDHDVVEHEGEIGWDIIIRMELATPLTDYLSRKDLTRQEVIRLGIDICKALELCQDNGIIHRDVKSGNLFLSQNGDYKLGDFGIAHIVQPTVTVSGGQGTVEFMAPEVYKEEKYDSTVNTVDTYSLGLVLHRLLNHNRMPYLPPYPQKITYDEKKNVNSRRIAGEPIPVPFEGDDALHAIILKACEYDPALRYETPGQMRRDLERLLHDGLNPVVAYSYMFPQKAVAPIGLTGSQAADPETKIKPRDARSDARVQNDQKRGSKLLWVAVAALLLLLLGVLAVHLFAGPEITVTLPEMAVMGTGYEAKLAYTTSQETQEGDLYWTSGDESILKVENGMLTAIGAGECTVSLTCGKSSDVCRIVILEQDMGSRILELEEREWYYEAGMEGVLVETDGTYYWHDALKEQPEELTELLRAAALQELGTASVDVGNSWLDCYRDGEKKDYCGSVLLAEAEDNETVIVVHTLEDTYVLGLTDIRMVDAQEYIQLRMAQESVSAVVGETLDMIVYAVGSDGSLSVASELTWLSADPAVAEVAQGVLLAVAPGTTLITATDGAYSCVCTVTVEEPPADTVPAETNPTATKPAETKPAQTKPTGTEPPETKPVQTKPAETKPAETRPAETEPAETEPPETKPAETEPPETKPAETEPPETEPAETEPPETEPEGKAPGGYSISLSPSSVYVYQTFYVTVRPDVDDYTKIVIHAIDPTGERWDFVISSGNSYDLMVTQPELTGTWTIYADVYNAYGVFYGASSGARAYLKVSPLF